MKLVILVLLILVIFAVSVTLGTNNNQTVVFNYLFDQSTFRLSTLLAVLFGSGFVLGWLVTGIFYLRIRLRLTNTQRKLKKLQKICDEQVSAQKKLSFHHLLTQLLINK